MKKYIFGEKCADVVASFGGSWSFIFTASIFIGLWMVFNSFSRSPFDPAPFIGLNLVLSCIAAFQAPFILMAGNRQSQIDRERDEQDFKFDEDTNERIRDLEAKMDRLFELLQP